jgi:hypothetical protein
VLVLHVPRRDGGAPGGDAAGSANGKKTATP